MIGLPRRSVNGEGPEGPGPDVVEGFIGAAGFGPPAQIQPRLIRRARVRLRLESVYVNLAGFANPMKKLNRIILEPCRGLITIATSPRAAA